MTELIDNRKYRIDLLKEVVMQLHKGKSVEEVKEKFREAVKDVSHEEVAAMEQALIDEGLPVEEIQKMCDVHSSIFRESLDKKAEPETVPGHPLHTMKLENEALKQLIDREIKPKVVELEKEEDGNKEKEIVLELLEKYNLLMDIDKHYSKKENLIFPYLEKCGITAPPQVMWGVDDEIRGEIKETISALRTYDNTKKTQIVKMLLNNFERVEEMIFKEEKILIPMAIDNLTEADWYQIYQQSDEIGYCIIEPKTKWKPENLDLSGTEDIIADDSTMGHIKFETGVLTPKQIELMLNHMPFDMTFVDKDDIVRYFSAGPERIFTRTKAVIGRSVENCHPPASVHIVEELVRDFKEGRKDMEEFWIDMGSNMVHIRYFAVRDEKGEFVGTLEVTQDITRIRELKGEKRLVE